MYNFNMRSINLPNVSIIGDYAFSNSGIGSYYYISSLNIPNVETIGAGVFANALDSSVFGGTELSLLKCISKN